MKKIEQPILITGCPRSGTSFVAAALQECGIWGGKITSYGSGSSSKGLYENHFIRDKMLAPYLINQGSDPRGQSPLPNTKQFEYLSYKFVKSWRKRIDIAMNKQGYKKGPWYFKSTKVVITWPVWMLAYPWAQWIIVRRKKEDVINACVKTGYMNSFDSAKGWGWWYDKYSKRIEQLKKTGIRYHEIWPSKIFDEDNFSEFKWLLTWLEVDYNDEVIEKIKLLITKEKEDGIQNGSVRCESIDNGSRQHGS